MKTNEQASDPFKKKVKVHKSKLKDEYVNF